MNLSGRKTDWFSLSLMALGGLVLLFIVAPLAGLFLNTDLAEFGNVARESDVRSSVWLTLWTSMAATMACAVAGIPLAYVLARKQFPLKGLVNALVDIPIVIPHSAAGIAVLGLISRNSFLGESADKFGFRFVSSPIGIMVAMAFVSVPFLINSARDGFAAVPERLEKVALGLGASPARAFFTISLPLAWRSILSGLILMWARGMSEFGAVIIIAYHPMTTPVMIYERFGDYGLKYARPVSALFICVCLAFFLVLRIMSRENKHAER
ncbi:ABC transporter permease [Candidatus Hydrogenedentota bacterium]